jgi:pentatricopeptide repeat protein
MVASSSVSPGRIGKILEEVPSFAAAYRTLAACYGHLGRLDEAESIIKRLVSLTNRAAAGASRLGWIWRRLARRTQ